MYRGTKITIDNGKRRFAWQTAAVALTFLLVGSLVIAIFEYNQALSLQNQASKQDSIIRDLQRSLSLAQLTLSSIYINPDGSITGTNSIQRSGDVYVLTGNISGSITVQKSNIIIDGAGHTLQGYGGTGIDLTDSNITQFPSPLTLFNVTIKNLRIMDFNYSIIVRGGGNHTFYQDYIDKTVNEVGGGVFLGLTNSGSNVTHCTITGSPAAIGMSLSSGNTITENNLSGGIFLQISGNEIVDRNYWSDYLTKYPNATEMGSSGIGNTPYLYNKTGPETDTHQDNHPLMKPVFITLPTPSAPVNTPSNNPIDMYLDETWPPQIIERLRPLGNKGHLNQSDFSLLYALERLQTFANGSIVKTYLNSSIVENALDAILTDGTVTDGEVAAFLDLDHDYISNVYEVERYKTDPTKMDTSGLGIDDFNAIFTYSLDPNNKTQIQQFLAVIPNVSPRQWYISFGGIGDTSDVVFHDNVTNGSVSGDGAIVEVSIRDPLIQYLAEHSNLAWDSNNRTGHLFVNGTQIWNSYDYGGTPSYYFTHGRIGRCGDATLATMSILKLMGYKTLEVTGTVPANGTMGNHVWCETVIDGKLYVVNYGELIPREGFYQGSGWVISESSNYDSDWYL